MDAVGCFEGDEEEEEEDEEEIDVDEEFCKQVLGEEGVREAGWRLDAAQGSLPHLPGAKRHCAGLHRHFCMPQFSTNRSYILDDYRVAGEICRGPQGCLKF